MHLVVFMLVLGGGLAAKLPSKVEDRIVGGSYAYDGQFPYMASLQIQQSHTCGASILNTRWLLCAAHCIEGVTDVSIYSVVVGTNVLSARPPTFARYDVELFRPHQYYNPQTITNDIGLIKTKTSMVYNTMVKSVIINGQYIPGRVPTVISGWGLTTYPSSSVSDRLKFTSLPSLDNLNCALQWYPIVVNPAQICTVQSTTTGVCKGDSGGPLVVNGTQVGVVSFGRPCANGKPDVYTRVYNYINWIKVNMY